MANYTAVYEAAQAVVELLRREMTPEPVAKPESIGLAAPFEPEDFQLTVHLYHIEEDVNQRDTSYGFVQEGKEVQRYAPLPINLHLLLTAHSKAPVVTRASDELRVLGKALQVVRDHPDIAAYASGSLHDSAQPVRLTLEKNLPLEQLMRVYGGSGKAYKLSFGCLVNTVLLDSERTRRVTRVKEVHIGTKEVTP